MADCTGLENRRGVKPTVGSNPTLSVYKKDSRQIDVSPFFAPLPNHVKPRWSLFPHLETDVTG